MNESHHEQLLKEVASIVSTQENLNKLMRLLLLPFDAAYLEAGELKINDFYAHLKTQGVTYDHLGMQFAATKESRDRILSVMKKLADTLEDKKPKEEKEKKSYK